MVVGVANVHGPPGLRLTFPEGAVAPLVEVSVTVAVHDVITPTATVDVVHDTVVNVG